MSINRNVAITQKTSYLPALKGERHDVQPGLAVYTTPSAQTGVGIMVPKKCVALSVDRHRLKRRIAAIVATEPLANTMVVVRVLKKMDTEVDLSKLSAWFSVQKQAEPPVSAPAP